MEVTTTRQSEAELTPEEAALVKRLTVFSRMRWFFIIGIIAASEIALRVFGIGLSTLPVYTICAVMALYNLLLMYQTRNLKRMVPGRVISRHRMLGNIHIILDLVVLVILLHFTGGIENPFLFLIGVHIVAAGLALHYRMAYLLATSALLLISLLVGLEYGGVIPHYHLAGFAEAELYTEGSYILAVLIALAAILYASTYMATAVAGELRKRQRQVVELQGSLLREQARRLAQASHEISKLEEERDKFLRFLGIAAHDLKAPLTAIQGFLWVMLGGYAGELTDKQKNMLERSSRRITELLSLISDLLDIPRAEAGQIVEEMKDMSLRQEVKRCCDTMSGQAEEKQIRLKVEMPQGLPRINGSSTRLQQVMTNLLSNAINYTNEGTVTVSIAEQDTDILVEVSDTGIGIPADGLPKVFDEFYRASNVEIKGTGLGLSIVKRIVEAHDGKIWVESPCPQTGKGSRFSFTLPKKRKAERRQKQ